MSLTDMFKKFEDSQNNKERESKHTESESAVTDKKQQQNNNINQVRKKNNNKKHPKITKYNYGNRPTSDAIRLAYSVLIGKTFRGSNDKAIIGLKKFVKDL